MKYKEDSRDNQTLFLWLDLETTGLNSKTSGIIEAAGCFELNGEVLKEFELLINPFTYPKQIEVQEKALAVNNRTIPEIQTFLDQKQCLDWLNSWIEYYVTQYGCNRPYIVGYNVGFDVDFIKEWYSANNMKYSLYFQYKFIDVMQHVMLLSYLGVLDPYNNTLKDMCLKFGINIDNAHTAIADIRATRELSQKLVQTHKYVQWLKPAPIEEGDTNIDSIVANWGSKKVTEKLGLAQHDVTKDYN